MGRPARDFYWTFLRSVAFLPGASKLRGVNHADAWITREVIRVEGNYLPNSVHVNCCDKPRVMRFLPGNAVINDEPAPLVIEFWKVTQNGTQFSDAGGYPGGLARREPEPICINRTSGNRPRFVNVPGNDAYEVGATSQYPESADSVPVTYRLAMDSSNEDVGIDEDVHLPLVFTGVGILAAQGLIGDGWHALRNHVREFLEGFFEIFRAQLLLPGFMISRTALRRRKSTDTPKRS